jgi:hypothetical protein
MTSVYIRLMYLYDCQQDDSKTQFDVDQGVRPKNGIDPN